MNFAGHPDQGSHLVEGPEYVWLIARVMSASISLLELARRRLTLQVLVVTSP